jgi:peptide subunit release factor 1 (eRF1)
LGGTDQNTHLFREILPKSSQRLVVGEIPLDIEAPASEVLMRSSALLLGVEGERESELIETMMSAAVAGGRAVTGLPDTLAAAQGGQVQTLIMVAGFTAPAYRSTGCGYLTVQLMDECPFCGSGFEEISDAVNLIVRRVVEDGGHVQVARASEDLARAGGIGALLRY